MKISLYRVREISREIGQLAMQRMQERQDRWRSRTSENPRLKNLQHHQVNSAIEMVVNEGLESMYMRKQAIVIINFVLGKQLVYWMK
jgi:Glu-tRNA(Gln) amidotransferase subunit E-like FAD-binding protein